MSDQPGPLDPLLTQALQYYESYDEAGRLFRSGGQIERVRTQELILRYAPPTPGVVYDLGGGPGVYSLWLARQGYTVHLLDAVPRHIEQAREAQETQPDASLASLLVGDARHLPFANASADLVLLLGPLYHLVEHVDRVLALREAWRVLRPGGVLYAAVISRFSSLLDVLRRYPEALIEPAEMALLRADLSTGQHRNPGAQRNYFTTTFFHSVPDLRSELDEAGLTSAAIFGLEGPFWLFPQLVALWPQPETQTACLELLRSLEQEPSLLGASAHLLAVAQKGSATSQEGNVN